MKRFFTLIFAVALLCVLSGVNPAFSQDNELHAIYIEKNQFTTNPFKQSPGIALYDNINISQQEAPQNEPSVAISRTDPNIVVAAWRDFRLGHLEPNVVRRIGYSFSTDGGITWSASQLLPDPNPDHLSQSDPVVVCDMDGNFYISSTSRQPVTYYNREMLLYKSNDNGQTFQLHATAVPGSGIQGEDKEWIFVDPVETNPTYNTLMIAWRSFGPSYGIKFRKSDVGGANWNPTVDVSDWGSGQGANLATGIDGRVIVVWIDYGIYYDISYDGGNTFGSDRLLSGASTSSNNAFPFICVDYSDGPTRGNVYVVWADARQGSDDVWFQRSEDNGETWLGQPIRVNDVTLSHQTWPVVCCDTDGKLVVIYYDEGVAPGLITTKMAYSTDAGNTWTNEILSNMAFQGNAPNSNVRFGDYIEIDAYEGKIIPVWTDDRAGNYDQEIYTAHIDIAISTEELTSGSQLQASISPNPFTGSANLRFTTGEEQKLEISLFNAYGKKLDVIENRYFGKGTHELAFTGNIASGVYYVAFITEGIKRSVIKIVKL